MNPSHARLGAICSGVSVWSSKNLTEFFSFRQVLHHLQVSWQMRNLKTIQC